MNIKLTAIADVPDGSEIEPPSYQKQLTAFYQAAILNSLPVVLWRVPYEADKQALVDCSGIVAPTKVDFQAQIPGFVFSPFINEQGQSTLFLRADVTLQADKGLHVANHDSAQHQAAFLHDFQTLSQTADFGKRDWQLVPRTSASPHLSSKDEFCTLVEDAVSYIQSTDIKKVVASRATEVPLPAHFNPVDTFDHLCATYAHAFISLISIPGLGTWIGATPEILLTLDADQLHTIALAGTQSPPPDTSPETITWGAKEVEEQALVSDYVRQFFESLSISDYEEVGPETVSAGNIVHLRTDFRVNTKQAVQGEATSLLHLGNLILDNLHPTSAVCGMPKREALSFILEREQYARQFYSGFLGPVHINQQSQLFVNLRCMQLASDNAILYVGVGVTKDSVPELEWQETVWKSKTLLAVLEKAFAAQNALEPALSV
ncbi:MAG: chorismate-binding protein [Chloroflexota bacterium]